MAKTLRAPSVAAFEADAEAPFPKFRSLPGSAGLAGHTEVLLEDQSYDTDDLRLASAGIVLYRRTGGEDRGWHLELPDGHPAGHRVLSEPLDAGELAPRELTHPLQGLLRGHGLRLAARASTYRQTWKLLDEEGHALADVTDERTEAGSLRDNQEVPPIRTWRYQMREDAPRSAAALHKAFSKAATGTSAAALLAAVHPAPPADAARNGGPLRRDQQAFLAYWHEQLAALLDLDPAVRLSTPDAVHQMRVAARRLRSALSASRRILPRQRAKDLRDDLKWLGTVLGGVRDTEVIQARLAEEISAEPHGVLIGPIAQATEEFLASRLQHHTDELTQAMESDRYYRLLDALEEFERRPFRTPAPKKKRAKLKIFVRRDAKRRRQAVRKAASLRGTPDADPALHEARKAAKRLRYAAETAQPLSRTKATRLQKHAHKVQKVLGQHQDSIVTAALLQELGAEAHRRGESTFTYGHLYALEQQNAHQTEEHFFRLRSRLPGTLAG